MFQPGDRVEFRSFDEWLPGVVVPLVQTFNHFIFDYLASESKSHVRIYVGNGIHIIRKVSKVRMAQPDQHQVQPPEPPYPPDRKSHRDRVRGIEEILPVGKTGAICIDDTPEHRAWYLYEIAKYPTMQILDQGVLAKGIYTIKVHKVKKVE